MKVRNPYLIRTLGFAGACLLRGWLSTLRIRIDSRACPGRVPIDLRRSPCIYAFWHENILVATKFGARSHVLTSKHADGELISQVIERMGMTTVRGSSRRGGAAAALELVRLAQRVNLALTPDGPRGPRRRVQPGLAFLAASTGRPLVLIGLGYDRAWRARSWDRFAVPYPGSLVTCVASPLIHVPRRLDSATLEWERRRIEDHMHHVDEDARRWAEGLSRLPPLAERVLPRATAQGATAQSAAA